MKGMIARREWFPVSCFRLTAEMHGTHNSGTGQPIKFTAWVVCHDEEYVLFICNIIKLILATRCIIDFKLTSQIQRNKKKNVHDVSKSSLISILIEWAVDLPETYWREKYQSPSLAHQSFEAAWHSWRGYPGVERHRCLKAVALGQSTVRTKDEPFWEEPAG